MTTDGPVAVVTGGSRGLGFALTSSLIGDGWRVAIDGRDPQALAEAVRSLRDVAVGAGCDAVKAVVGISGDVADPAHRAALLAAASALGPVALLVNNASVLGPSPLPPLADYPLDALTDVFAVNVVGPLALIQATLGDLRRTGGTIINVTSDAAVEGYPGWGGYGSSKAALEQLSRVLAAEEPEVRVYWFDPGDMRTAMHQEAFPGEDIADRPEPTSVVPALRRLLREAPPSGRYRAADWQEATS